MSEHCISIQTRASIQVLTDATNLFKESILHHNDVGMLQLLHYRGLAGESLVLRVLPVLALDDLYRIPRATRPVDRALDGGKRATADIRVDVVELVNTHLSLLLSEVAEGEAWRGVSCLAVDSMVGCAR